MGRKWSVDIFLNIMINNFFTFFIELTMSFTIGSLVDGHFGLLGMDIYFMAWAKDLLFFSNNYKNYYSFLMDVDGMYIFKNIDIVKVII